MAARLLQLFADGATVILQQLQLRLASLAALCRSMEKAFSARFQTNVYMTPAGAAQGLKPHYDSHDVFVLQVEGSKSWTIYDTPVVLPTQAVAFDPAAYAPVAPTQDFVLHSGDMAYIPRGVVHDAVSTDDTSVHITLGAMVRTWADLLADALSDATRADPAFRRALPAGFADDGFDRQQAGPILADLFERLAAQADAAALLDRFAEDMIASRHCLVPGQLQQIIALDALDPQSLVGRRPNLLYQIRAHDGQAVLRCYGKEMVFPGHVFDPLRFALMTERYSVGSLPGDLDDDGKCTLIRRLVREGLVVLHAAGHA